MKYWGLQKISDVNFRTATGFKREAFEVMVEILRVAHQEKMKQGGRPHKNSVEDQLLISAFGV